MVDRLKPDAVTLTYYVPIGNDDNTDDRVKVSIKTFSSGDTVEWLTWLKSFERLIRLKGWGQDGHTLFLNARIVLRDMGLDIFNAAAAEVEGATPHNFNTVMMQVARSFLVQDAREHLIDMIRNRRKTRDVTVTEHLATMRQLSTLITTLPENDAPVSEKTLMYYFRKSVPLDWQTKYEESGREASTLTELARYFRRLEMNAERKEPRSQLQKETPRPSNPPKRNPSKDTRKPAKHDKPAKPATGKWCSHHSTNTHSDEECHYQQKKRPAEFNYCELPDGDFEELNAVHEIADPEDPREVVPAPKHKCETIIRLRGTGASRLFSALIDTGASRTLIDPAVLDREQLKRVHGHGSPFRLPQGAMKSRGDIAVKMQLTEFGENRSVQWSCAVADQLPDAMIIGRDLIL